MKIVTQIIVSVIREDESRSVFDEQIISSVGDNPKFEASEVGHSIEKARALVMERLTSPD